MTGQLGIELSDGTDDLISRNLIHCCCCHGDLDRVTDFSHYSDDELDTTTEERLFYCGRCNSVLCSCDIQWDVYEPDRDELHKCSVCGLESVVFGSEGW